jgi:hypothetical protein
MVSTESDQASWYGEDRRSPAKRLLQEGRKIDLSRAAFARLAGPDLGLVDVTVRWR